MAALALYFLFVSSSQLLHQSPQLLVVMVGFVSFVVNVEVPLEGDAISLGYAAGLLIYFVLGEMPDPAEAFVVIALGGLIGGLLRGAWRLHEQAQGQRRYRRSLLE